MAISVTEVEWVAKLAYLSLLDSEHEGFVAQFSAILDYIAELQKVDTTGVSETMQITGQMDHLDEDAARSSAVLREELLKRAPQSEKGYVKVRSVFE